MIKTDGEIQRNKTPTMTVTNHGKAWPGMYKIDTDHGTISGNSPEEVLISFGRHIRSILCDRIE